MPPAPSSPARAGRSVYVFAVLFVLSGAFLVIKLHVLKDAVRSGRSSAERAFNPPSRP